MHTIPRCSFCNASEDDAGGLVEGPEIADGRRIHICQACADLCASIIKRGATEGKPGRASPGEALDPFLKTLTALEGRVVGLRYGLANGYSYSPEEAGDILAIPPERVREIEGLAVQKLKFQASSNA